jgi:predicted Zn-dependent protease with MMP-like domain
MSPKLRAAMAVLGGDHPTVRDLLRAERGDDAMAEILARAGFASLPRDLRAAIGEIEIHLTQAPRETDAQRLGVSSS